MAPALAIVALTLSGCAATAGPPPVAAEPTPAAKPVRGEVWFAVDCGEPNRIGCDRVVVGVRLTRPADEVTMSLAGRSRRLDAAETGYGTGPRWWEARFGSAGLTRPPFGVRPDRNGQWSGRPAVRLPVSLSVRYRDGTLAEQTKEVRLSPFYCG